MAGRNRAGDHAEMAAVVEERQEALVEPRQWPDHQNERQQQEGAAAI